ncbi:MAG: hypothetical protein R2705_23150 [Ilumatobacteraceae bacterium]
MPWALLRFVGVPDLPSTSSIDQAAIRAAWQAFVRDGRSDHVVVVVLAVVVWVAWLRIAIALVVEVVARLARRPVPRLPGLDRASRHRRVVAVLPARRHGGECGNGRCDRHPRPSLPAVWPAPDSTAPGAVGARPCHRRSGPGIGSL